MAIQNICMPAGFICMPQIHLMRCFLLWGWQRESCELSPNLGSLLNMYIKTYSLWKFHTWAWSPRVLVTLRNYPWSLCSLELWEEQDIWETTEFMVLGPHFSQAVPIAENQGGPGQWQAAIYTDNPWGGPWCHFHHHQTVAFQQFLCMKELSQPSARLHGTTPLGSKLPWNYGQGLTTEISCYSTGNPDIPRAGAGVSKQ